MLNTESYFQMYHDDETPDVPFNKLSDEVNVVDNAN
jgi:hypothetical protein